MKKVCLKCGNEFEKPAYSHIGEFKGRKFCSHLCSNRYNNSKLIGTKRPPFSKEWIENIGKASRGKKRPPFSKKWKDNISKAKVGKFLGSKSSNWKGGRTNRREYIVLYMPNHPNHDVNNYVCEHRIIMERHLGRYLTRKEVVHHINGIKGDNRIDNLKLFNNESEHHKFHTRRDK